MEYSRKTLLRHPKDVPVSTFLALSIITVYILFATNIVSTAPCGNKIHHVILSNFTHIEIEHLLANLYALYALSRVELQMGFKSFIWLLVFLLGFNTIADFLARRFIKGWRCSIGFSGVLFGMLTWELVSMKTKKIDITLIIAIIVMVVAPSIHNNKISLAGHAIGAVSGVVGGLLWKLLNEKNK